MAKKPSYIDTLNAIANNERTSYEMLKHWSAATKDKKLKTTLDMVAIREMEHRWAFEKRLCELGYSVTPEKPFEGFNALLKLMKSNASDEEKFAGFGIGANSGAGPQRDQPDSLLQFLADTSIDPKTGELIGRFICEERDSGAQLVKAYKAMQRRKSARTRKKAE
jgi:rubrerythrin